MDIVFLYNKPIHKRTHYKFVELTLLHMQYKLFCIYLTKLDPLAPGLLGESHEHVKNM